MNLSIEWTQLRQRVALTLLSIWLPFAGCAHDDFESASATTQSHQIYGSWEWVRSEGGYSGERVSPLTSGHTITYVFEKPSRFKAVRNRSVLLRTHFSVGRGRAFNYDTLVTILHFGEPLPLGGDEHMVLDRLTGDSLVLVGTGSEALHSIFSRSVGSEPGRSR